MSEMYAFDAPEIIVEFNARPGAATPAIVAHKLRKPTLDELSEREKRSAYEMVEVSTREDEIRVDDEAANAWLWGRLILGVRGYDGATDWQALTEEQREQMRPGHKITAIRGLYLGECSLLDDDGSVSLSAQLWNVRQELAGGYVVTHTLREWTEAERLKFKRAASSTQNVRGTKKAHVKVITNLRAYTELFDLLWQGCEGGTVDGRAYAPELRDTFLRAIDPIWKRQIIQTLNGALEAQLQD